MLLDGRSPAGKDGILSGGGDDDRSDTHLAPHALGGSWWEVVGSGMRRGLAWLSEALSAVWAGVNAVFWSMHGL